MCQLFGSIVRHFFWALASRPNPTSFPNLSNFCRNYFFFAGFSCMKLPLLFFISKMIFAGIFCFSQNYCEFCMKVPPLFVLLFLHELSQNYFCMIFLYETPPSFFTSKIIFAGIFCFSQNYREFWMKDLPLFVFF